MIGLSTPWLLLLLLGIPAWVAWRRRALARESIAFPPLQLSAVAKRGTGVGLLLGLEAAVLALTVVALAGPTRGHEVELFDQPGVDLALVLDISASMQAADFAPNRLEVLKKLAKEMVKRRGGDRVAVYAFAAHVQTQAPFTTDSVAVASLIDGLSYESIDHNRAGGTAIGDALLVTISDLKALREPGREQVIVLVTDGESNLGADPLLAARLAREEGIRAYVIGIGQDKPVPVYVHGEKFIATGGKHLHTRLDDAQLKQIARLAGGPYFRADSSDVLARTFEEISKLEHKPLRLEHVKVDRSLSPLVALAALVLLGAWLGFDGLRLRRPLR